MRAVDDAVCGGKLVTLHCCAAALYSDSAHRHWERSATTGVDVLRQKIFRALNALQQRLYALERELPVVASASPPAMSGAVQISALRAGE